MKKRAQLARLRALGLAEGTSFLLLLFVAMPLKYAAGEPLAVRILGSIHGGLFVLYALAVLVVAWSLRWDWKWILGGLASSVVPFGPFVFDRFLQREMAGLSPEIGS